MQVIVPTFLFAGDGDGFATPDDVLHLESRLTSSKVKTLLVDKKNWSHLDFILSIDAGKLVYKPIMETMEQILNQSLP